MTDELAAQLERIKRQGYGRRRLIFDRLQEIVSLRLHGPYGVTVAYPDVFLFVTAEDVERAISEILAE